MLTRTFPPHPALRSALMPTMLVQVDGCLTRVPPAWSPMLNLYLHGGGTLERDGTEVPLPRLSLSGAVMQARRCRHAPGTVALTVMLRPGALEPALGIPPQDVAGKVVGLERVVSAEAERALLARVDACADLEQQVACFHDFLLRTLRCPVSPGIADIFINQRSKLFDPLSLLASELGAAERTLERRVRAAFGITLRELRRIMRFGLALQRLSGADTEWGDLTALAQELGYYDQAHMHREFLEFSGLPPLQLVRKIASDDPDWWVYRIPPEVFTELFLPGD